MRLLRLTTQSQRMVLIVQVSITTFILHLFYIEERTISRRLPLIAVDNIGALLCNEQCFACFCAFALCFFGSYLNESKVL
jgi:hypothetical protein